MTNKFYLAGAFTNENNLALGAVIFAENYRDNFKPNFALSIQKSWKNIISLGTTLGLPSHGGFNFGLNGSLRIWGVQFYVVSDNIIPVVDPLIGQNFNIRTGINIAIIGKDKTPEILEPAPNTGNGF